MWTSAGCGCGWFGESREERESMALDPRASSSFTVGGSWEMQQGSMGVVLTLGVGVGSGSILEDKLGVIS